MSKGRKDSERGARLDLAPMYMYMSTSQVARLSKRIERVKHRWRGEAKRVVEAKRSNTLSDEQQWSVVRVRAKGCEETRKAEPYYLDGLWPPRETPTLLDVPYRVSFAMSVVSWGERTWPLSSWSHSSRVFVGSLRVL